jgi:PAS domain S-box-containing protein
MFRGTRRNVSMGNGGKLTKLPENSTMTREIIPESSNSGPRVLLVDDRPQNLTVLEGVLGDLDLMLFRAAGAEEALRHLLHYDFAAILLDVEMPGIDGFQTARLIRTRAKSRLTPIIFLTAFSRGRSQASEAYSLGAVDYIVKPFDPAILRWKVSVLVDLHQKNAQLAERSRLLQDTNAQLQKQQADLQWERNFVQSVLDTASSLVVVTDIEGRIIKFNRACEILTGQPSALARGKIFWDFCATEDADECKRFVQGNVGELGCETHWLSATGAVRLTSWCKHNLPYFRESGRECMVLTGVDVTDRQRAEQERAQAIQERAARLNQAKDQFLALVSHELRTPLTAIIGWIQILRTRELSPEKNIRALESIERNARLQEEIIRDILDVSRIGRGQLSIKFEPIDLRGIVEDTLDTVRFTADAKSLQLESDLQDTPKVLGDRKRLHQVFSNLLSNAIKFTPEHGIIKISLEHDVSEIRIRVLDTGKGIGKQLLPHIFEPFIQGDSTTTRQHGGLGIGLTIVHNLVQLHGGTIQAESPGEGKGAVFTVRLPISSVSAEPANSVLKDSVGADSQNVVAGF